MKLYHGSNVEIKDIDLNKSKPNKDFGQGFYLSDNLEQALEMAKIKVLQLEYGQPIVNTYSFNENLLKDGTLRVKRYYDYTKDWAEFIVANRKKNTNMPIHDYDVVIGPIADDRIGVQLWQYESKMIDLETLMNRLKYIKGITIQYYFGTDKSIKYLERV